MSYSANKTVAGGALLILGALACLECGGWQPPAKSVQSSAASSKQIISARPAIFGLAGACAPPGSKFQCNPVTNEGCDGSKGEACDDDEHDGFGCYPEPNAVKEGGDCNDDEGPSCEGTLGCDTGDDDSDGVCRPYCCSNADCRSKNCVVIDRKFGTLGFCK